MPTPTRLATSAKIDVASVAAMPRTTASASASGAAMLSTPSASRSTSTSRPSASTPSCVSATHGAPTERAASASSSIGVEPGSVHRPPSPSHGAGRAASAVSTSSTAPSMPTQDGRDLRAGLDERARRQHARRRRRAGAARRRRRDAQATLRGDHLGRRLGHPGPRAGSRAGGGGGGRPAAPARRPTAARPRRRRWVTASRRGRRCPERRPRPAGAGAGVVVVVGATASGVGGRRLDGRHRRRRRSSASGSAGGAGAAAGAGGAGAGGGGRRRRADGREGELLADEDQVGILDDVGVGDDDRVHVPGDRGVVVGQRRRARAGRARGPTALSSSSTVTVSGAR